ncbi:hypothetical protein PspS34_10465 [Pseudomonas sp. S34]|jgi:hypothetical protein|nr:hypothetical protein PspS34_10465 [Pseudomonas sp. S34]
MYVLCLREDRDRPNDIEPCGSELAREKRLDNTINQAARVIVDVHREQARSYRVTRCLLLLD